MHVGPCLSLALLLCAADAFLVFSPAGPRRPEKLFSGGRHPLVSGCVSTVFRRLLPQAGTVSLSPGDLLF